MFVAGVSQFLAHVAAKGCAHDVVVGDRRVEHAEALVVLRREQEVSGAGSLNHTHPLVRVELDRIERLVQIVEEFIVDTLGDRAVAGVVGPSTLARPAHRARHLARWVPVHEHTETAVLPLFDHFRIAL